MAKKRRRRAPHAERRRPAPPPAPRLDRRAHKEEARRAREAARKHVRRRAATARIVVAAAVGALAVVVFLLLNRAGSPGSVPQAALRAAEAAGCGDIETPAASAPGNQHAQPGEVVNPTQRPPTSGLHYGNRILPPTPHVYDQPVDEIAALHNLEHAYVVIYYRADGKTALGEDVVRALAEIANAEDKVILAPAGDLQDGRSLVFAAWNKLWQCPAGVTAEQARTMATGFVEAYRGTSNAPEPLAA